MKLSFILLSLMVLLSLNQAKAEKRTFKEIDTCYHWLEKWQLDAKVEYAKNNDGKLAFYGGYVIYCWRTPLGAQNRFEDHGDYLIRIKFKPDVIIKHSIRKQGYKSALEIAEVIYSNNEIWHEYTVTPEAVESWSAYHPLMIEEIDADLKYHKAGNATEDDVFYPFKKYNLRWLKNKIPKMIKYHKSLASEDYVFGRNIDQHFKTETDLPWHEYLDTSGENK